MDGIHVIEVTCGDGSTERRPCGCDWCEVWRAMKPDIDRVLREFEPEVRPDWLGPKAAAQ